MSLQRKKQLGRGGKPLKARPRSKGNRAEAEIVAALRLAGWIYARRNFGSGSQGGADIIEGPKDVSLEIKHHERCAIKEWIRQVWASARPTDIPMVVFRRNHSAWFAAMPWKDWEGLLDVRPIPTYVVVQHSGRVQLWSWLTQAGAGYAAGELPVVSFMCDDMRYAAVPFDEVLVLLRLREESQTKESAA